MLLWWQILNIRRYSQKGVEAWNKWPVEFTSSLGVQARAAHTCQLRLGPILCTAISFRQSLAGSLTRFGDGSHGPRPVVLTGAANNPQYLQVAMPRRVPRSSEVYRAIFGN